MAVKAKVLVIKSKPQFACGECYYSHENKHIRFVAKARQQGVLRAMLRLMAA